jgi:hypothetical protein
MSRTVASPPAPAQLFVSTENMIRRVINTATVHISPARRKFLGELVDACPLLLRDIDNVLEKIVRDGDIDIFDVPYLIEVVCIVAKNVGQHFARHANNPSLAAVAADTYELVESIVVAVFMVIENIFDDDDGNDDGNDAKITNTIIEDKDKDKDKDRDNSLSRCPDAKSARAQRKTNLRRMIMSSLRLAKTELGRSGSSTQTDRWRKTTSSICCYCYY